MSVRRRQVGGDEDDEDGDGDHGDDEHLCHLDLLALPCDRVGVAEAGPDVQHAAVQRRPAAAAVQSLAPRDDMTHDA